LLPVVAGEEKRGIVTPRSSQAVRLDFADLLRNHFAQFRHGQAFCPGYFHGVLLRKNPHPKETNESENEKSAAH
jgi:hypothetical protein